MLDATTWPLHPIPSGDKTPRPVTVTSFVPQLYVSVPPKMSRLFLLCFTFLSLLCAIQCTPASLKRSAPSARPDGLVARGLCYFRCPHENVVGRELGGSHEDSGRLYCRYEVEGMDDKAFCMYKMVGSTVRSPFVMLTLRRFLEHRRIGVKLSPFSM